MHNIIHLVQRKNDGKTTVTYHFHNLGVDRFGEDTPGCGNVVNQLVETCSLYFFTLEIRYGVHEVEYNAALQQLVDEQILLLRCRCICNQQQRNYSIGIRTYCITLSVLYNQPHQRSDLPPLKKFRFRTETITTETLTNFDTVDVIHD